MENESIESLHVCSSAFQKIENDRMKLIYMNNFFDYVQMNLK